MNLAGENNCPAFGTPSMRHSGAWVMYIDDSAVMQAGKGQLRWEHSGDIKKFD